MRKKRLIAIADIHGCAKEFEALLSKTGFNSEEDTLVIVGDAIDRGYDSEGVIRKLIELKDTPYPDSLVWLMGNHEYMRAQKNTKHGLFQRKAAQADPYARLLSELPLFYETESCIFVHAGYDGDYENQDCLLEDRTVLNGERIYSCKLYIAGHSPFYKDSAVPFDQPVFIDETGLRHTVYDGMKLPEKGALFIDTGCVYKNRLTALIIDEENFMHLSSVMFTGV